MFWEKQNMSNLLQDMVGSGDGEKKKRKRIERPIRKLLH